MRRPDRHAPRRLMTVAALAAMVTTLLAAPASHAAGPEGGALRASSRFAPSGGSRGSVDVASLPAKPAVPLKARTSPDLRSPFAARAAPTSDTTADTTDTTIGPSNVVTTSAPPAAQPGWAGMRYADTGYQPADPWVAAGPEHIVQVVNT